MKLIDNINSLLGDDLKASLSPKARLKIAASHFSIYAYEALKAELAKIASLEFIFTLPTFVPNEVTDKLSKERREFFISKGSRERDLYGSEFEIQLRNKLTQKAIARECADWMRHKARFRSNKTKSSMQQFACIQDSEQETAYMPLYGFTAVDLGYQQGDAVSNIVSRFDEPTATSTYLQLFDQIWNDPTKLEDVSTAIYDHIASVYQENAPERLYFLILYNIFSDFLEDIDENACLRYRITERFHVVLQKLFEAHKHNVSNEAETMIVDKIEECLDAYFEAKETGGFKYLGASSKQLHIDISDFTFEEKTAIEKYLYKMSLDGASEFTKRKVQHYQKRKPRK